MSVRMSHDQKETAIEFIRAQGTLKAGANAAGVTYQTLYNETKRSPIFARRVDIARKEGTTEIGDRAIENIKKIASEENKDVRSRLTANLSLANWTVPNFRGESKITGHIDHNVRVTSALPRPDYKEMKIKEEPKQIKQENNPKLLPGHTQAVNAEEIE